MTRQKLLDIVQQPYRITYTRISQRCPICLRLYSRSKRFDTPYRLLYHLNIHDELDENAAKITKNEVREVVKNICKAIEWNMPFDDRDTKFSHTESFWRKNND
ncbi:MAG: hypothetical protein IIC67_01315 [Thaumarchaeota archaeon]|nr:hypothetical protein [Nitrososphaerota archaeon]